MQNPWYFPSLARINEIQHRAEEKVKYSLKISFPLNFLLFSCLNVDISSSLNKMLLQLFLAPAARMNEFITPDEEVGY